MRIGFVTPFYHPERQFGGPPRKIHSLAKGLRSRQSEVEVEVITFDHANRSSSKLGEVEGVPVTYLPWSGAGLRQWPHRHDLLRSAVGESDLVHCFGLYNCLCPLAVRHAVRLQKPVVIEPLGMFPPRARNQLAKRIFNASLTRWMVNRAAAVIATSESEAFDLRRMANPDKIVYRRNGIDVSSFTSLPSGAALRARWSVEPDDTLILFIGRLSPIKNLEQLLLAFAELTISNQQSVISNSLKLVLVGPGEADYERRLRALVGEKNLHERVVFAGALYDDEQKAALAAADQFVLPSLNESFGNAAGEAVAANVPVLLTDTCGIAPIINGRAGLAVPLGVEPLVEGLRLMLKPEIRDQMTARIDEVKRELSWEEPIAQTIKLYEQIRTEKAETSAM